MARIIGSNRKTEEQSYSLARMEDVDYEEMKKRWMESDKAKLLPDDDRTITEIQASEDTRMLQEFAEFFGIEGVDPTMGDPLDTMVQISNMMEEGSQDVFQTAEMQRELNIEEDAAERIQQIMEFEVNTDDPLLQTDYKEKSERIIKKLLVDEDKKTESRSHSSIFEEAKQESARFASSSSTDNSFGRSSTGTRTASATTTTTTHTVHNNEQREKEVHALYADGADRMRNLVANGPVWKAEKKQTQPHHFSGKKKFRFKNMVSAAKSWLSSNKADAIFKVGIAVCLETALAVITKQRSFDGPGQTLGYIGMMLGVFYIGSELRSIGYDQRRLAMI